VQTAVASSGFILTASADGHVKFWKKQPSGIEFVKHFIAHMGAVISLKCSTDGTYAASLGSDGFVKVYDVLNFGSSYALFLVSFMNVLKLSDRHDYHPRGGVYSK